MYLLGRRVYGYLIDLTRAVAVFVTFMVSFIGVKWITRTAFSFLLLSLVAIRFISAKAYIFPRRFNNNAITGIHASMLVLRWSFPWSTHSIGLKGNMRSVSVLVRWTCSPSPTLQMSHIQTQYPQSPPCSDTPHNTPHQTLNSLPTATS